MLPIKNGGMDEDGHNKLNIDINFENNMSNIRKKCLFKIKKFRET